MRNQHKNHYSSSWIIIFNLTKGKTLSLPPKGLLLYEQSPSFILNLPKEIEFDQLPFAACIPPAALQNDIILNSHYQVLLSNLAFDWLDAAAFIQTVQRMLAPEGRCWFSAYGEQTAVRSKSLLAEVDSYPHFNAFYSLQEIGDALLGNGFKEVVVESNIIKLEYTSAKVLAADANKIFGVNMHPEQRMTLSGKELYKTFCKHVEQIIQAEGKYVETVEIMLVHAKMPIIENVIPVAVT